eukprot:gene9586-12910_t
MAAAFERDMHNAIAIIPGKLFYVALSSPPPLSQLQRHFFSIDNELVYWNFYLDFGPLNLGHLYRFCCILNHKMNDEKLKEKTIYFYSGNHGHKRANAAYLITAWSMLYLNKTPDEAFKPFKHVATTFPPWHDATPTVCHFNLTVLDTLRGLYKARECGFFNFAAFDVAEYEHYEQVENGDLNWCMEGKFVAFAGPHGEKERNQPGGSYYALRPEDYVPYFKKKNVTLVVRLNKPYYDARKFTSQGIDHSEMYFIDGSNPPDHILARFIQKCEETSGAVAVHCKAGLGRTGTCIGCYIMKHFKFTAEEIIGWLRIVRPGSIIGPQQQYMKDMQARMWREGDIYRARLNQPVLYGSGENPEVTNGNNHALTNGHSVSPGEEKARRTSTPTGYLSSRIGKMSISPSGTALVSVSGSNKITSAAINERDNQTQGDLLRIRRQQHMSTTGQGSAVSPGNVSAPLSPALSTSLSAKHQNTSSTSPNGNNGGNFNLMSGWK